MFIDSHAHITDPRFDQDREQLIEDLEKDKIELVINPGVDLKTSMDAVNLAEKHPKIYAAVGFHPHDAKEMDQGSLKILEAFAKREKVVAIGEIGLDYYYDNSPREIQKARFIEQIELAKKLDLPIIVHSRDADQDSYEILKAQQDGNLKGVMHCYSGDQDLAKKYIDLGFYISIAGPVTFKNGEKTRQALKAIPLDRLMIETDSPYLAPEPKRGKRNEPSNVRYVAARIAEELGLSTEDLAKASRENTKKLFQI